MSDAHDADIKWQKETHVPVAPERLFTYLADFTSARAWDPFVVDAELTSDLPIQIGTKFCVHFRMGPTTQALNYTITEYEAPNKVVLSCQFNEMQLLDTIEIRPDATNPEHSIVSYCLEVFYQQSNALRVKIGKAMVNRLASKSFKNLRRLGFEEGNRLQEYPALLDKSWLPGLYQFTRYGFFKRKQKYEPLPINRANTRVVITGTTSGLGGAMAVELARAGVELIMINRSPEKAQSLAEHLRARFKTKVHCFEADLSSVQAAVDVGKQIAKQFDYIDVLINNAGDLRETRETTTEGFELHFALLLLSPFALIQTLLPNLQAGGGSKTGSNRRAGRVVNLGSGGLYAQPIHFDDLQYQHGEFNGAKAYARNKRALVDITQHAARLFDQDKLVFHAMHPGWAKTPGVERALPKFANKVSALLRTPFQGAETGAWLALSRTPGYHSGKFWLDRQTHTTEIVPGTNTEPAKQAQLYEKLLELSQRFVQQAEMSSQAVNAGTDSTINEQEVMHSPLSEQTQTAQARPAHDQDVTTSHAEEQVLATELDPEQSEHVVKRSGT